MCNATDKCNVKPDNDRARSQGASKKPFTSKDMIEILIYIYKRNKS